MSYNFGGYTDEDFARDEESDAKMDRAWELHRQEQIAEWGKCACGEPAGADGVGCEAPKVAGLRGSVRCGKPICAACAEKQQVKRVSPGGTQESWETYCRECYDEHQASTEDSA